MKKWDYEESLKIYVAKLKDMVRPRNSEILIMAKVRVARLKSYRVYLGHIVFSLGG
jgi:hypothetical protein